MNATKLNRRITEYMHERGITQAQFAAETGISRKTLYNARTGNGLTLESAFLIAKKLGVTLDDLYCMTH